LYLVKQWDAADIYRAFVTSGPWQWPLASALRDVGLTEIPPQPLVLLYCLERLAFWARTAPHQLGLLRTLSALVNLLGVAS